MKSVIFILLVLLFCAPLRAAISQGGTVYSADTTKRTKSYTVRVEKRVHPTDPAQFQYRAVTRWFDTIGGLDRGGVSTSGSLTPGFVWGLWPGSGNTMNTNEYGGIYATQWATIDAVATPRIQFKLKCGNVSTNTYGPEKTHNFIVTDIRILRVITLSYTNTTSAPVTVGVLNSLYPGVVDYGSLEEIGSGASIIKQLTIEEGDTGTYSIGVIDVPGAFAAGGGSIDATYSVGADGKLSATPVTVDFTGHITPGSPSKGWSDGTAPPDLAPDPATPPLSSASGNKPSGVSAPDVRPTPGSPGVGGTSGTTGGTGGTGTGTNPSGSGDALTVGDFNAGINKLNTTINSLKGSIGGGGSTTVNVDFTGVHSRLDTSNQKLTSIDDNLTSLKTEGEDIRTVGAGMTSSQVTTAINDGEQSGAQAASDFEASPSMSSIKGYSVVTGVNPAANASSVSMPFTPSDHITAGAIGSKSDLSPTQSSGLQSLLGIDFSWFLAWTRNFIAACSVLWFLKECVDETKTAYQALAATPQYQIGGSTQIVLRANVMGNSVGVVPGMAMYAAACIAVTTILIGSPTLIAAGIYTYGEVSTIIGAVSGAKSALGQAAGSAPGIFAKVFDLANAIAPIALLITIAVNRLLISIGSLVQFVAMHVGWKILGMV